jgi:carboxyl-terminal processing protease
LVVAAALLARPAVSGFFSAADPELVGTVESVNSVVNEVFFEEPDARAMRDGAVRGMLDALGDQYTQYIPPRAVEDFRKQISGDYVGIGAEVRPADGFIEIVSPMDDSPALRAGLEAGDRIIAVNGRSIFRLGVDPTITLLQGDPGTEVTVTVEREADTPPQRAEPPAIPGEVTLTPERHTRPPTPQDADPDAPDGDRGTVFLSTPVNAPGPRPGHTRFDLTITRARIQADTVRGVSREGDRWRWMIDTSSRIGYVRISQFTEETVASFPNAIRTIAEAGGRGLVIDLRFNSGGSLRAAVVLADLLLDSGVIVSTRGRSVPEEVYRAKRGALMPDAPIAVLVNGFSASASEVLSGALKDNGRAVVVGERTVGKGLVQSVFQLPAQRGELKLTTARYYLPSGRNINRDDGDTVWGVDPSEGFYVPVPADEAIDTLVRRRNEEVLQPSDGTEATPDENGEPILARLADRQLTAAVEAVNIKLNTGEWQPTGQRIQSEGLALEDLKDLRTTRERILRELERVQERIDDLSTIAGAETIEASDLLPDDAALTGGTLVVRDASGAVVAELTITGETLERWLIDAPLEPAAPN